MDKIKEILEKYSQKDLELFKSTVEELYKNGFQKGCFQDYGILVDITSILCECEAYIKNKQS